MYPACSTTASYFDACAIKAVGARADGAVAHTDCATLGWTKEYNQYFRRRVDEAAAA